MNRLELAETLIAIADTGAIHKAATKLHQTNAAISKKLSKLEAHLGVQLINRGRKGLSLTDAGQRYYHEAKNALKGFIEAEQAVIQTKVKPQGELKISVNQYFARKFILPKLVSFMELYPELKLNLDIAEVPADFNAKKMDILFGSSMPADENLVRKPFFSTQHVLCASPGYLKKHGTPHTPAELLRHHHITHGSRKRADMIMLDHHKEVILTPTIAINNAPLMIEAALLDLGIILMHHYNVEDYLKHKKLIRLLEKFTQATHPVCAYYEYQRYRDPKIQVFMDFFTNS
ncbi:MAG TPA: LysR family transcriptional regulator [Gammaproteobacteria bacterium]|nr:LysR family transcriptional regulator [Gammaproteobacteria bacterium]